jgi:hypothetical protein
MTAQLVIMTGCTSGRRGALSATPELIERVEIEQHMGSGVTNLYDLILRARPRWLEQRGDRSLRLETVILVYHNQSRLGGIEVLHDLRPDNVMRIRRLDSARAGLLPGGRDQHVEAAIVFETMASRQ